MSHTLRLFFLINTSKRHINVTMYFFVLQAECDLYGYLNIEGDIVISVMSTKAIPNEIQVRYNPTSHKQVLKIFVKFIPEFPLSIQNGKKQSIKL